MSSQTDIPHVAAADLDARLYARLARRDPSLDGRVFVGVKTTGVYCRPVCRARLPLKRNIEFLRSAAAAEAAGYRPCLRCRPEAAPSCPAWRGTRATVDRALKLIDDGALVDGSVADLAARLGVGARHLSRLFAEHLGDSPGKVDRTRRLQRAKRLIDETDLALGDVAARAGFSCERRLRAAFAALYGRPPSAFRSRPPSKRTRR
ncbi:MAG: Ada metal-binding domain-containing protein [Pseudomonadota bacterium]